MGDSDLNFGKIKQIYEEVRSLFEMIDVECIELYNILEDEEKERYLNALYNCYKIIDKISSEKSVIDQLKDKEVLDEEKLGLKIWEFKKEIIIYLSKLDFRFILYAYFPQVDEIPSDILFDISKLEKVKEYIGLN